MRILLSLIVCSASFAAVTRSPSSDGGATCSGRPCTFTVTCSTAGVGTSQDIRTIFAAETTSAARVEYGDTVLLQASNSGNACVWSFGDPSGTAGGGSEAPRIRGTYAGPSDQYITITSSEYAKLPNNGTRITQAYLPLMPTLQATTANPVFVIGTDRVKVRGLRFRTSNAAVAGGFVHVGYAPGAWSATNLRRGGNTATWESTITADAAAGADTLSLSDASWVQIGHTIAIMGAFTNVTTDETKVVTNKAGNVVTLDSPLTTARTVSATRIRKFITDGSQQPDDIVIQHSIFENFALTQVRKLLTLEARKVTVRDNLLWEAFDLTSDSQGIGGVNGTGPYVIENNAITGSSENIMWGGSPPSWEGQVESALVRFNWLAKFKERHHVRVYPKGEHVWRGLYVWGSDVGFATGLFVALDSGVTGSTEPTWDRTTGSPTTGSITTDSGQRYDGGGGIRWRYAGAVGNRPLVKNAFELKSANNVTLEHNLIDGFWDMFSVNVQQRHVVNVKTNNQLPTGSDCDSGRYLNAFPLCYHAQMTNFQFLRNQIRIESGGFFGAVGSYDGPALALGNVTVKGNLVKVDAPVFWQIYLNGSADGANNVIHLWTDKRFTLERNTFVHGTPSTTTFFHSEDTTGMDHAQKNGFVKVLGNIFPRGANLVDARGGGFDTETAMLRVFGCTACTSDVWSKNVVLGGSTSTTLYPASETLTNCPTSATCSEATAATYNHPTYGQIFRLPAFGQYQVNDAHGWAKRSYQGEDVGADLTQIPNIEGLNVQATDRQAIFRYTVTEPIKHIPCVLLVNTRPDMEGSTVGEMSNVATYYRHDADDADHNIRTGLERMISIGHGVPLSASTTFYYWLQCGGDARRGSFTTRPTLSGNSTVRVSAEGLSSLTWGTTYSRTSDSISGGGSASCAGGVCTFTATRGSLVYQRSGSGSVRPVVVQ